MGKNVIFSGVIQNCCIVWIRPVDFSGVLKPLMRLESSGFASTGRSNAGSVVVFALLTITKDPNDRL